MDECERKSRFTKIILKKNFRSCELNTFSLFLDDTPSVVVQKYNSKHIAGDPLLYNIYLLILK